MVLKCISFLLLQIMCLSVIDGTSTGIVPLKFFSNIDPKQCNQLSDSEKCSNLVNATLCSTVTFCMDQYWIFIFPQYCIPTSIEMNDCIAAVEASANEIPHDGTQDNLISTMQNLCTLIEEQNDEIKACQDFMEKFAPNFLEVLNSILEPDQICNLLGVKSCEESISEDDDYDYSDQSILTPPTIETDSDESTLAPPGIETDSGESTLTFPTALPSLDDSNDDCSNCQNIVPPAVQLLKKMGKSKFETEAKNFCNKVPKIFKNQCKSIVQKQAGSIYNWLTTAKPVDICKSFGFCTKTTYNFVDDLDYTDESGNAESSGTESGEEEEDTQEDIGDELCVGDYPMCPLCEFAMNQLSSLLQKELTKEEIQSLVEKVCTRLPASIREQCNGFVGMFVEEIVDIVVQELNTSNVCALLKVCPNTAVVNGNVCELCQLDMKLAHLLLNEEGAEPVVEESLSGFCSKLPTSDWSNTCSEFMSIHLAEMFARLKEVDLRLACNDEAICSKEEFMDVNQALQIELNAINMARTNACSACITTLKILKKYSLITAKYLDMVCYLAPPPYSYLCKAMVDEFGPWIVKMLVNGIQPEVICKSMKLCQSLSFERSFRLNLADVDYNKV